MKTIIMILLAVSPYISRVLEYQPAPGQFTNTNLCDPNRLIGASGDIVYLGAYGGYVTFGFDHRVMNMTERPDLLIRGNGFLNNCEPGIIMVSRDENGNGEPDDKWYEIAGAAEDSVGTIFGYEITYYKPDSINQDILWRDNRGDSGYVYRNGYHTQAYWPENVEEGTLIFRGTRLPDNAVNVGNADTEHWLLPGYAFGYADNTTDSIDLDWAVDIETREKVYLDGIDFVRVYTAINQSCGWIGETSTEILGAEDLNVTTGVEEVRGATVGGQGKRCDAKCRIVNGHVVIETERGIYDLQGKLR